MPTINISFTAAPTTLQAARGLFSVESPAAGFTKTGTSGLVVSPATLPNATVGVPYSQALTASGGTAPYVWDLESAAPNSGRWLALPLATLIGTPQYAETSTIVVRVTDATGLTAAKPFTITSAASGVLSIVTTTLPGAINGSFYAYQLIAKGGIPPYTWSWTASQPWQVTPGGWLEGTPTATGTVSFANVKVTDSAGTSATFSPQVSVGSGLALAGYDSTLSYLNIAPAIAGNSYQKQLIAYGGGTWSVASGALPPGLSINSSGLITGTPTAAGNTSFTLKNQTTSGSSVKFTPGHYLMSDIRDYHGGFSPTQRQAEIDVLATTGTGGAWPGSPFKGYFAYYSWDFLESSLGVYDFSPIYNDFLYLQSKCPGAQMVIGLWYSASNGSGWVVTDTPPIPSYILSSVSTYGAGPTGGSGSGYGLSGWNNVSGTGARWQLVSAAVWRAAVQNRYNALIAALATTVIPDGNGFTFDTHPNIEAIIDPNENSWDFFLGPQAPSDWSASAQNAQIEAEMTSAVASFPHTAFATFQSFGNSTTFPDPNLPGVISFASSNRNALSNADCFGNGISQVSAQEIYCGNVWNGSAWVSGGTDYRGTMAYMAVVQQPDYVSQGPNNGVYPQQLAAIYATAQTLHATHILWNITDDNVSDATFVNTNLLPFVSTHAIPNTTSPSNYPTGSSVSAPGYLNVSASTTTARPAYNSQPGSGFFVLNGKLYSPSGLEFRVRGVNRAHYDSSSWAANANGALSGANTCRLFMFSTDGSIPVSTYVNVAQQQMIQNRIIPIITMAYFPDGTQTHGNTSTTELTSGVNWWVSNVSSFSPIMSEIMINVANEWGPGNSTTWRDSYISAVGSLRTAGYTCPIVIDTGNSGQDPSNILLYASAIQAADPLKNCVFSYHVYGGTTNQYATISNITTSGGNTVVTLNNSGTTHPFCSTFPGNSFTGFAAYFIAGVNGLAINGTQPTTHNNVGGVSGAWTVTLTGTFTGTYSGGGYIVPYDTVGDVVYYQQVASDFAALQASNICVIFGEFGPGLSVGPSPTTVTPDQIIGACEAYQLGWIGWAWDDNNLPVPPNPAGSSSWSGGLSYTLAGPGTYSPSTPSGLTAFGADATLNPRHGLVSLPSAAPQATILSFSYFISPTGDDNNAGTLISPWSITALNNNQATYAGKSIGFLPGTYQHGTKGGTQTTLYAMLQAQANGYNGEILSVQGGTAASPTVLASCDSSGNYSPRTAIIDCSNPSGGALPTNSGAVFGQVYGHPAPNVSKYGNVIFDGLVIRNWTFSAILLQGNAVNNFYPDNAVVKNCEIYNGQNVQSNQNPAAIWAQFSGGDGGNGLTVTNCKIHDLQSNGSGTAQNAQHFAVLTLNGTLNTTVTNCTTYNCCALSVKDGWQQTNASYNYFGWGTASGYYNRSAFSNDGDCIENYVTKTGLTVSFHHNIVCGPMGSWGESQQQNEGTVQIYNNTFFKYGGVGGNNTGLCAWGDYRVGTLSGGGGTFQFYNNLVYAADGNYDAGNFSPGVIAKLGAFSGGTFSTLTNTDYNVYGANGNGIVFGCSSAPFSNLYTLAQWRALGFGYDTHSITIASSPFSGTPTEPSYLTFAVTGAAATASMTGGPCGAVDGSGAIGSNF